MVKTLLTLLVTASTCFGGYVVLFNPTSTPVANKVTAVRGPVPLKDYLTATNALTFDTPGPPADVVSLKSSNVPQSQWKVSGTNVVELSQAEKDAEATALAAAQAAAAAQALLDAKNRAKQYIDSGLQDNDLLIRALAIVVKDELNILRVQHGLAARTDAQLKAAITNEVDNISQ